MKSKTKLKLGIVLICATYGVLSLFIFELLKTHQGAFKKVTLAQEINTIVFERRLLADEYLTTRTDRPKAQWYIKQNDLKELLTASSIIFRTQKEQELIDNIKEAITTSEETFSEITKENNKPNIEKDIRLSSQLAVFSQEAGSAATKLAEMNSKNASDSFRKIITIFAISSIVLFLILMESFRRIWSGTNELYQEKTKVEAILNGIGDGVFVIDKEWNILLFNKAASEISGWSQKEALYKPLRNILKFIKEHTREENVSFIEKTLIFGKAQSMENSTLLITKNGEEIPVADSSAPFFDEEGKVIGAIVVFRDVAQERKAAMLKSDFTYASHQFRTPIGKATWSLESVLNKTKDERVLENLNEALSALKSINKLSSDLLDISNIDQMTLIPKIQEVKIADIISEILTTIKKIADSKDIVLEMGLVAPDLIIKTDPKLLSKCLMEIFTNATLYSPQGSKITYSAEAKDGEVLITIQDFGMGIREEDQGQVFHKFFRGRNFNTSEKVGAGLGMYIAKAYITLLKGKIWFTSKDNEGTSFFIKLPQDSGTVNKGLNDI